MWENMRQKKHCGTKKMVRVVMECHLIASHRWVILAKMKRKIWNCNYIFYHLSCSQFTLQILIWICIWTGLLALGPRDPRIVNDTQIIWYTWKKKEKKNNSHINISWMHFESLQLEMKKSQNFPITTVLPILQSYKIKWNIVHRNFLVMKIFSFVFNHYYVYCFILCEE